ncbi:oligosaccharide flippase family protein [Psychrobacter sp. DAB_AL32B]|uniref:oligosaccharide flippase family protein n=1 Tax=Psychrobacter sp. DAB_AL32B TaxID=1028414 RepID=UPI000B7F6C7E|nr:oligosaccharide flippase family protein [Psychrobacter sp. DAB_AL32B]OXL20524.1 polysaccharide biosynthesis protein [Psychrobacter sp. DAB_AL32B]
MTRNKILGYAIGPIGAAMMGFITLPIITWFYSVEDVGRISMLQVVASFSVLLFCLGLDQAYVREYHEHKVKPKLFKTALLPGLILSLVFFGPIFIFDSQLISKWLYDIPSTYLTIISIVCFVLSLISRFLSLILRMEERALAYSMSQLLPKILFLVFILSTVWLGLTKDAYNLITAHTLSITAIFLVFAWNTRKEWLSALRYKIDYKELNKLLAFGLPLVVGGLAAWGLKVMDKLFLRGMSTFSELGVYSVAASIAGVAAIFAGIFNTIWAPMVYKWVNEGVDLAKIDEISEHLLAAIYFVTVLSGLFSWILPYFLPKEYAAIQYLITACLLGPLFYTLSETTAVGITIARKTKLSMVASIGAMSINVVGNYILVPRMGAAGAAVSTAVAFWVFYILRTELSRLVWRNMPRVKAYLLITLLLVATIIHSVFLKDSSFTVIVWSILLLLGFIFFRPTVNSVYTKTINIYKQIGKKHL